MPDLSGGNDFWRDVPNGVVEQDQRQTQADDWASQQRAQLAQSWADSARQQLAQSHPDLAVGVQPASTPPMPADMQTGVTPPSPAPTANSAPRGDLNDISQFGQAGLSYDEALAACGPAAAVRLLSMYGQNIPLSAALAAAKQVGWTNAGGMNGIGNEKRLLDQLGVPAIMDTSPSTQKIITDAQSGNPVTVSTPNHYFTISGYDPNTGLFHVGQSGLAFRGGSADMTWDQIKRLGGGVNGALFVDSPASGQPGTAALETGSVDQYQAPLAAPTAPLAAPPQMAQPGPAPVDPTFGLDGLAQQAGQALGGAGAAATSAVQQAGSGFSDILNQARQAVGFAGDQAQQAVQGFTGPQPMAASQQPTPSDTLTNPVMQQNPTTPAAGALQAPPPGPGAMDPGGFVDNLNTLRQQVAPSIFDPGAKERADMRNPENALSVVAGVEGGGMGIRGGVGSKLSAEAADTVKRFQGDVPKAIDALKSAIGEGATVDTPGYQKILDELTAGGQAQPTSALNVPANQATAQMLQATPPKPPDDGVINWAVRKLTNRNVSADQFQERALSSAGLDLANPPEALDLSARIRQFATDGTVKVAEDSVLRPAVQSLKGIPDAQQTLSSLLVHQNVIDEAASTGNTYRQFPGGNSLIKSQTALSQMKQALGPQDWQRMQDAADKVYGLVGDLRQTMLGSGLISQHDFNTWQGQQPHFIPTRILDFLDEGGGPKIGTKVSLSDNGVHALTREGTTRAQEDPLGSVLNSVAQVNRNARKNDAVAALLGLDKLGGKPLLVKTDAPVTAGGTVVQYVRDGKVERYTAPAQLAAVINGPAVENFPKWVQGFTGFTRAVNTIASPAFALVRNPSLDVPEYLLRQTSRAGGNPLAIPHIIAELGKGYADAFQGLLQGEFRGAGTKQYLAGGGSGSTMVSTFENRSDIVKNLAGGTELKSVGDVQRILKSLLGAVPAIAERTELGPRIAAMRLAEQQGATPLRATMAGRTVTMDFNEGGTFAKSLNQAIPFFNAGVQGTVIPARMFHENPGGAIAAATMMVGLPAVAAEAWNNSDPQRAKDYADVPQYLKQGGVVFMLPGQVQTDQEGNRKPGFYWLNMRGMAPFADIARQAAAAGLKAAGNQNASPEDWAQLLQDMGTGFMPVRANTIGDVGNALTGPGLIPGAMAWSQLASNKDLFRGSDIVSKYHDQNAPASTQALAQGLTAVARAINPRAEIHPSQVDFAIKQLLGGVGSTAEGVADPLARAAGFSSKAEGSTPVLGGAAHSAGLRNDTGETYRSTQAAGMPDDVVRFLQSKGVSYMPGPVSADINSIPLRQDEQTRYQALFNQYAAEAIREQEKSGALERLSAAGRDSRVKQVVDGARGKAGVQTLQSIPAAEKQSRLKSKSTAGR